MKYLLILSCLSCFGNQSSNRNSDIESNKESGPGGINKNKSNTNENSDNSEEANIDNYESLQYKKSSLIAIQDVLKALKEPNDDYLQPFINPIEEHFSEKFNSIAKESTFLDYHSKILSNNIIYELGNFLYGLITEAEEEAEKKGKTKDDYKEFFLVNIKKDSTIISFKENVSKGKFTTEYQDISTYLEIAENSHTKERENFILSYIPFSEARVAIIEEFFNEFSAVVKVVESDKLPEDSKSVVISKREPRVFGVMDKFENDLESLLNTSTGSIIPNISMMRSGISNEDKKMNARLDALESKVKKLYESMSKYQKKLANVDYDFRHPAEAEARKQIAEEERLRNSNTTNTASN